MFEILSFDLLSLFTVENLAVVALGTLLGMAIGAMPGLGPTVGVAVLMPLTYGMDIIPSILLLTALYQGAEYGGSISAILLGIPGTASASATALDGNPMAKQGAPGRALGFSLWASTIGGFVGGIVLLFFMAPLARMAFKFSDPELFLIALFGLVSIVTLGSKDVPKSIVAMLAVLLLKTVGTDLLSGVDRYTMEIPSLMEGFTFIAVITGLFAFSEVLNMVGGSLGTATVTDSKAFRVRAPVKELFSLAPSMIKSSLIGVFMGIIPGLGPSAAAWMSYNEAKRTHPKTPFGTGVPLGIVSCESSNNACVGGALLPLLTMGIPGSGTIAVMASAFLMKGIQPGPQVLVKFPDMVYSIIWGFMLTVIMLPLIGKYFTSLTARLLAIPNYILVSIILLAIMIGAYGARSNMFDVGVALAFGCAGFILNKLDYPFPSFLMAFILGDLVEVHFRRALTLSRGSYSIFYTRPICILLLALIAALIFSAVYKKVRHRDRLPPLTAFRR